DRAGLQENDIIMEVNGMRITEEKNLTNILKSFQAGETITLKVFSRGSEKNVTLTLGEAQ
ncbi:MAG: PDZ domain-containing protein, partial [bacterium]|nr:PDZ domain-containing protein [bacterium]